MRRSPDSSAAPTPTRRVSPLEPGPFPELAAASNRPDRSVRCDRGRVGEALAAVYLESRGLRILDRNRRVGRLEVDLLALSARELVVVEVRLRSRADHGTPEETVDRRKRARLRSAGRRLWEEVGRPELALRFDLVAVLWRRDGFQLRYHPRFLDPHGPGAESLRGRL